MKAWCALQSGEPHEVLALRERPRPGLPEGHAVIENEAVGLSYADVLMCRADYQFEVTFPYVPGGETVGIVREVASVEEHGHLLGRRVLALGGGLEEYSAVQIENLFPIDLGAEDAAIVATIPVNYCTAEYCLDGVSGVQSGDTVLVLGAAGGLGSALLDLAKLRGATTIAVVGGIEKVAACKEQGCADTVIDYFSVIDLRDAILDATGGHGIQVCADPVGGPAALAAMRCITPDGIYVTVGFASGTVPSIALNHVFMKGYRVAGANWGAYILRCPETVAPAIDRVLDLFGAGRLRPLVTMSKFERGRDAVNAHANRTAIGKQVVQLSETLVVNSLPELT